MRRLAILDDWSGTLKDGWRSPQILLLLFAAASSHRLRDLVGPYQQLRGREGRVHGPRDRHPPGPAGSTGLPRVHRRLHAARLAPADLRDPVPRGDGGRGRPRRLPALGVGDLLHDGADVDRLPLPRDHGAVPRHAVDEHARASRGARPHEGDRRARRARHLRPRLRRVDPGRALLPPGVPRRGVVTLGIAVLCRLGFPRFRNPVHQNTAIVLRPRYWLYYALEFLSGARRQIFLVFAAS